MSSESLIALPQISISQTILHDFKAILDGEYDVDQVQRLLRTHAANFANFLAFKVNNAASKSIVESGTVHTTTMGTIALDQSPDIQHINLLAEEFKLDELHALALVLEAQERCGEVSAAAAAGLYYDERYAVIQSVIMLLHAQIAGFGVLPQPIYAAVSNFNASLLSARKEENAIVARLAELIHANSAVATSDISRLPVVWDAHGRAVDRYVLLQRENLALCHALILACAIKQRIGSNNVARLFDLLHHLALRAATHPSIHAKQQTNAVLVAVILTLLPLENAEGSALDEDNNALRDLSQSTTLDSKVRAGRDDSPYATVALLAWGVLALVSGTDGLIRRGVSDVSHALRAGAIGYLASDMLQTTVLVEEVEEMRLLSASTVHQLLMLFVECAEEAYAELRTRSLEAAAIEVLQDSTTSMAIDHSVNFLYQVENRAQETATLPREKDSLATLISAVGAALALHPGLFLDETRRAPQLAVLAGMVGADQSIFDTPSVLLAYIDFWKAMASTHTGAEMVFRQLLSQSAPERCSWRRMFSTLRTIISMYAASGTEGRQHAQHLVLPAPDTAALCAFARLFERVMKEGAAEKIPEWLHQLEEDAGVSPAWDVMFQTMCCPVPQSLKAALDRALAAIARVPDLAAALWDRVLSAMMVYPFQQADAAAGAVSMPHYDLVYQLNEVQGRSEDYEEAVAFVELLNALWSGGGQALADHGRDLSHFTRFVREELLGTAFQRTFKIEAQRWRLIATCLDHCRICIESNQRGGTLDLSTKSPSTTPLVEILTDLLEERAVAGAALTALLCGTDVLSNERHTVAWGAARESAVLAALRVLRAAFDIDMLFVAQAQRFGSAAESSYETMDMVLCHDRTRVALLLDYVRYPHRVAVQEEALKLSTALAQRVPGLVHLLLTCPAVEDGDALPLVQRLQDGFASALADGLQAAEEDESDSRAKLTLNLLLSCLESRTPNLTQLLCGFHIEGGTLPIGLIDPRGLHTPLRVVLELLSNARMAFTLPLAFEQSLQLVHQLAAASDTTGPAMLDLLRTHYGCLLPLMHNLVCTPLPRELHAATLLHQRAWLLKLYALEMHCCDLAVASHHGANKSILSALFFGANDGAAPYADALLPCIKLLPLEPQLGSSGSSELRRMLQALDVETALGAAQSSDNRGDVVYDIHLLKDILLQRYNGWIALQGSGPVHALREACHATLTFANDHNAWVEYITGQAAVLNGWQAIMEVAFSERFDVLANLVNDAAQASDLVLSALETSLDGLAHALQSSAPSLAGLLASTIEALLVRLHEQTTSNAYGDAQTGGLPVPARAHNILTALMTALWEGRGQEALRLPLYSALVSYFATCRGPAIFTAPPEVVSVLVRDVNGNSTSRKKGVDTLHSALEEGNVAILHANLRVLGMLTADAGAFSPSTAMAALTALAAWLSADPTSFSANDVHESALPARLLQELGDQSPGAISQPAPAGHAAVLLVQARLDLLMRLVLAGPTAHRAATAQKLFSVQALPRLTACRAIDVQPEEPGFSSATSWSLRHRLHLIIAPMLRLVLVIFVALPHSAAVCEQVVVFVETHHRTLSRILRDVASSGVSGWDPGDMELEQATLCMELLGQLAARGASIPAQIKEAAYRAAARLLTFDGRCSVGPVARLHSARQSGGSLDAADLCTRGHIWSLRCALATYLRLASSRDEGLPLALDGEVTSNTTPTLLTMKDALLQVALHDLPDVTTEYNTLVQSLPGTMVDERTIDEASARHLDLSRLVFLVEQILALFYQHLRRISSVASARHTVPALAALRPSNDASPNGKQRVTKKLDHLRRLLHPALTGLEQLASETALPADLESFELLLRRVKDAMMDSE